MLNRMFRGCRMWRHIMKSMKTLQAGVAALSIILLWAGCDSSSSNGSSDPTPTPGAGEETNAPEGWGPAESWVLPSAGGIDPADFVDDVTNPYWPLEPGMRWTYTAVTEDETENIEVEVLAEKREVMGVLCTQVRDTVSVEGELIEDTIDWYAQDTEGNVWYFGEETKEYGDGEVSTAGSWEAGIDGAMPGIKMWAEPQIGEPPYYQEYYEGKAVDLAKDLRLGETAIVPFGTYNDLLLIEEWNPLEPNVVEWKYYAEGIGTVKEQKVEGGNEVVELIDFTMP